MKLPIAISFFLGLTLLGCSQNTTTKVQVQPASADQTQDQVKAACDLLQNANQLGHFRDALQLLSGPLAKSPQPLSTEDARFLQAKAHLSEDEMEDAPSAPIQRQARAPTVAEFETVALPEQDATRREGWGPGLTALGERTLTGKTEIDALSLAFPFAIGTLVALSIAVRRRRQKQNVDQG